MVVDGRYPAQAVGGGDVIELRRAQYAASNRGKGLERARIKV